MKKILAMLCLLLALCLSLAACGQMKDTGSPGMEGGQVEESVGTDDSDKNGIAGDVAKEDSDETKTEITDSNVRKLIKDVELDIETKTFDTFIKNLEAEISKYNGFIQSSDINNYSGTYERTATVTARIPADKLSAFTNQVSSLANVIYKKESIKDVTMKYVDIESHIKALKTEQESLLKLLESAKNLNDIITIQNRLTEVRSELESYEAQLRTYKDLIAYSTVKMTINEVERETQTEKVGMWQQIGNNLSANTRNIIKWLKAVFVWFVSSLPYLILIALIILVITLVPYKISKRKKRLIESIVIEEQNKAK